MLRPEPWFWKWKTTCKIAVFVLTTPFFSVSTLDAADQNIVVVFDDSGSMNERMKNSPLVHRIQAARDALLSVLQNLPDNANVGVRALNSMPDQGHWIIPLGPIDRSAIKQQVNSIQADGATPLGIAMAASADVLLAARQKQIVGSYRMLIVTDGEATDAGIVERVLPKMKARGIVADVIGVDMRGDHSLATQVQSYRRADDPKSLQRAIAEVFAETSSNAGDAGDSDYDLISGLPDEVAAVALTTITQVNNEPLGDLTINESVVDNASPANAATSPNATDVNTNPNSTTNSNTNTTAAPGVGFGGLCCFAFVCLFILGGLSLLKSGK